MPTQPKGSSPALPSFPSDRHERIRQMEAFLRLVEKRHQELELALEASQEAEEAYRMLLRYYNDPLWMEDFEADERGELPEELLRGVLSEDGLYNCIADHRRLGLALLELARTFLS